MQTILLIENDIAELETFLGIFEEWQTQLNILTARDKDSAVAALSEEDIDIILCSTSLAGIDHDLLITEVSEQYPFTPCIAISSVEPVGKEASPQELGVSYIHAKPYNTALLFEQITELLGERDIENIKDIPTHSLLQMIETEERTCTVKVYGKDQTGFIYILRGIPVAAEADELKGEFAVFEIIGWDDVVIEILYFNGQKEKEIDKPLIALIMEGFRQKDEQEIALGSLGGERITKPQLKKISTIGQRLSLDIGSRVKVEFNDFDGTFNATTIGMLPDEYLIISKPTQMQMLEQAPETGCHVLIKYLHMGKLCLFKSTVLSSITNPQELFFLEYPSSIHYHELRKTKRTKIFIPCTLHFPEGGEFFGALIDMSSTGGLCQIKAKGNTPLPAIDIDGEIELRCLLPGMKEEQQIHAVIKNMKQNKNETLFGIEFFNMHSYLVETINRYLFSIENLEK